MVRELLIDVFTKWRISDIILLISIYMSCVVSWITVLTLGLKLLGVKIKLKHIIPGALAGACISAFIRPFLPEMLTFFIVLIPLLLFLQLLSKAKWVIVTWVTILLELSTVVVPVLLIISNPTIASFFHDRGYGMVAGTLAETLGAALLLLFIYIFNVTLIPNLNLSLTSIDFTDVFLYLALWYWCSKSTIVIGKNPNRFLIWPIIEWLIAAGGIVAFSIHKVKDKKKDEKYQELEESKIDMRELENICNLILQNIKNPPDENNEINLGFDEILDIYFTPGEQNVLRCLAQGKDNIEIAKTLCIVPGRAATLVGDIKQKTLLPDRNKMILFAIYWVKMRGDNPVEKPKQRRLKRKSQQ